jgi:hypothetical protein
MGNLIVNISDELHDKIRINAIHNGMTIKDYVTKILEQIAKGDKHGKAYTCKRR